MHHLRFPRIFTRDFFSPRPAGNARPDVGLLANVAGFGKFGRYDQIPLADSLKMIDLNCKALVAMTELTLPYMKRGAKLLNLDSLSAFQPVPYLNVYASTRPLC